MAGTELIKTRHDPTQHFMYIVSFRNDGYLTMESSQESVSSNLLTSQNVSTDVTQILVCRNITGKHICKQCTYFQLTIRRFLHFRAGYCNQTGQIYMTCIEKTANEDYSLRINCPYSFTFIYRCNVVDLYTHISCRMRTIKNSQGYILSLSQCSCLLINANAQIGFCYLSQSIKSSLEVCLFTFQCQFEVWSQRICIESRNKNCSRSNGRICYDIVRTLFDKCKHAALQQSSLY